MSYDLVSVVIPTLNRPKPLRRAVLSVLRQEGVNAPVEIVVVDNADPPNANAIVSSLDASPQFTIRYVHEPAAGVSNARNRGVREANGQVVAFLDDDEEAQINWLSGHLDALRASGAHASFGPVVAKPDGAKPLGPFAAYFERAFDRPQHADITDLAAFVGTNNSAFVVEHCFGDPTPFAPELNQFGGEDSVLLQRLVAAGSKFVWSADSFVTEWVPDKRLSWSYVQRRRFVAGQIRCLALSMSGSGRAPRIALWMAVGAAQAGVFGPLAGALALVSRDRSQHYVARAFGGLGKMFWMRPFRRAAFYTPAQVASEPT